MNEELQNEAVSALKSIITSVTEAKEFVIGELPEVINQLLLWELSISIVENLICIIIMIISTLTIKWFWVPPKAGKSSMNYRWESKTKAHKDLKDAQWWQDSAGCAISVIGTILLVIVLIVSLTCTNLVWLKIWLAPKIFLIEYAADLVK